VRSNYVQTVYSDFRQKPHGSVEHKKQQPCTVTTKAAANKLQYVSTPQLLKVNTLQNRMHSILRKKRKITKQETVTNGVDKKRENVVKVVFVAFNEAEEEERRKRGVRLRTRIRREKESRKLQQNMAQVTPQYVWAALVNATNLAGLNTLAANNAGFRRELYALFGCVAAVPNSNIHTQQPNALGVLNAMVAAAIPFPTLAGNPDIMDCLYMIGALPTFRPFLAPPTTTKATTRKMGTKNAAIARRGEMTALVVAAASAKAPRTIV
jgi:hypothetical protein